MEKAVYNLNRNVKKSPPEEVLTISLLLDNIVISKEIANSNALDFSRFFKLASKHKILPLICNKIITLNLIHELPAQYAQKVKNTIITATVVHTDFKEKLFTFSKIMKKNSIDFLVLKGFAIDKCPFRTMNDLDVLVKNDEIDKIFEVLEKENYKYVGSNVLSKKELNNPKLQYKWNNQFQFKVPNDNIVIEVHTNLFERDRIRLEDLSSLLDNVDVFWKNKKWDNDLQCFLPSIEAT